MTKLYTESDKILSTLGKNTSTTTKVDDSVYSKTYINNIISKNPGFSIKLKPQLSFSERFRVFYGKGTYVLVDTEKGLLAKVKKSKEATDDIEVAVLYLILKGFIHLKTSQINLIITGCIGDYLKICLYELANQYNVVAKVNNGYYCTAIPRSTKRMVKCLIDNARCNSKE